MKNRIEHCKDKPEIKQIFTFTSVAIFLIYLCIGNIIKYKTLYLEFDTASIIGTAVEMFRQRRLFLNDWGYQSVMLVDSPEPLTAIFTGMVGNVMLAQGISVCVIICLLLLLVHSISRKLQASILGEALGMLCLLFPYDFSVLGWGFCLTTDSGCYLVRFFYMFLVMDVFLSYKCKKKCNWKLLSLYVMTFLSVLSSGLHGAVTCVLPFTVVLFAYIVWNHQNRGDNLISKSNVALALVPIMSIAGYIYANIVDFGQYTAGIEFVQPQNLYSNIKKVLLGMVCLLGIPINPTELVQGLEFFLLTKILILLFLVFAVCYGTFVSVKSLFKGKPDFFVILLTLMFYTNMGILCLTVNESVGFIMSYRYHIFTLAPVFILFIHMIDAFLKICICNKHRVALEILTRADIKCVFMASIYIILSIAGVGIYHNWMKSLNAQQYDRDAAILSMLDSYDDNTVICYNDYLLSRRLGVMDVSREYIDLREGLIAVTWGKSYKKFDNYNMGERVLVLIPEGAEMTEFRGKGELEYLQSGYGYDLWKITNNRLDFSSCFPYVKYEMKTLPVNVTGASTSNRVRDFAYSPGVKVDESAKIQENGSLMTSGKEGVVWSSVYDNVKRGDYTITLKMSEMTHSFGKGGRLEIIDLTSGETLAYTEFLDEQDVILGFSTKDDLNSISINVFESADTCLTIQCMEIESGDCK